MIIIVFLGTIYQGELGLYLTQKIYFSSWIYWLFFIPLPAGRLLMLAIFINLLFLLFRKTLWRYKKLGILIVHFGALLLFFGGGITAYFSYEGQMTIKEGESSNYIEDYYIKELAILPSKHPPIIFNQDQLVELDNHTLRYNNVNFQISVLSFLINSKPINRMEKCDECRGPFASFQLVELTPQKEFEQNNSAIIFKVEGVSDQVDGVYASMVFESNHNQLIINNQQTTILLRPERTTIPFKIKLVDFKEVLHPGTDIAKSYSSDIILNSQELERKVVISMNEPLRHHEYTFFQSAFNRSGATEYSTLAVVKNYGRMFPYISSIIMCIGLLLHLIIMFSSRLQRVKAQL